MKEVFIVRHGPAVNVGESGIRRDADRVLSEDGRKKTREAAEGLRSLECRPALIASSPLIRAIETADIFADVLQVRNDVLRLPAIGSPIKLEEALSWIRAQRELPVMLVGHMPGL